MESLDMLSNNLANASTAGYRAEREFYAIYADAAATDAAAAGESPFPIVQPLIERTWIDLAQATLHHTGRSLDLAISGPAFFAVQSPSGALYTRNGSFQVAPNGEVVTTEGYPLRLEGGGRLRVDSRLPLIVSEDGHVEQEGRILGRLELAGFASGAEVQKIGNSYLRGRAVPGGTGTVHQGKLENSNFAPAQAAVRLVSVMRQFEMLQKAIGMGGEMNRRAIEEVARPTS